MGYLLNPGDVKVSKVGTYLGILSVTVITAYLLGLMANTGTSALLSWLSNPETLFTTSFYTNLNNVLSLFAVAGVVIGLFFSQKTDQAVLVGFTGVLFLVGKDMITIYQNVAVISADFALLFFAPFLLVYFLTVLEWWRAVN